MKEGLKLDTKHIEDVAIDLMVSQLKLNNFKTEAPMEDMRFLFASFINDVKGQLSAALEMADIFYPRIKKQDAPAATVKMPDKEASK